MNVTMKYTLTVFIICVSFHMQTGTAFSSETGSGCGKVQEQISLSIRFNGMSESASNVQVKIKEMENKVASIGKELGMKGMKPTQQNFNLSSMQGSQGNGYSYNGGLTFQVKPFDSAIKLADRLKAEGYQITLSVNRYPIRGCSH